MSRQQAKTPEPVRMVHKFSYLSYIACTCYFFCEIYVFSLTGCMLTFQNTELFTLTYGSLVAQLVKDFDSDDEVNKQLDDMLAFL